MPEPVILVFEVILNLTCILTGSKKIVFSFGFAIFTVSTLRENLWRVGIVSNDSSKRFDYFMTIDIIFV